MKYIAVFTLVALTVCAGLHPALAQGTPVASNGPIRIDSCDYKTLANEFGGMLMISGHKNQFFNFTFTNIGKMTVTDITFKMDFEKSRYILNDVGTFLPGSQTTHHLRDHGKGVQALTRPADEDPKSITCAVLSAKYADGTTWTANP